MNSRMRESKSLALPLGYALSHILHIAEYNKCTCSLIDCAYGFYVCNLYLIECCTTCHLKELRVLLDLEVSSHLGVVSGDSLKLPL